MVPVTNQPRYWLERSVQALNGDLRWEQVAGPEEALAQERRFKETPPLLRKLVQAWQESGPDLVNFSRHQPKMWTELDRYWKAVNQQNLILLVGAPSGGAAFFMNSHTERDPYNEALRLFLELLVNPECDRLAGPCSRCGNYYIRRLVRNKVYCSRSCGTRATALAATKKRRDEEHADKLKRADESIRKWEKCPKGDWKAFVTERGDISVKFLTRAVNNGELTPPTKGRKP